MNSDDWCTPKWLCDLLGPFDLDPCSNAGSHVRASRMIQLGPVDLTPPAPGTGIDAIVEFERRTRTEQGDGLTSEWGRASVFCNPPYSDVGPWARKLTDHAVPWCALLKLDPSTRWWGTLMEAAPTIAPFRKRLRFEGDLKHAANFPSVLVYSAWRPSRELAAHLWLPTYATAPSVTPTQGADR